MPKNMPKNQEDAAVVFQAAWRGRQTRKSLKKAPTTASPSHYSTFVTGNEPRPTFSQSQKQAGHFVLVGTSGLTNLHLMKEMTVSPAKDSDGYTGVPKLYVLDNSARVKAFWVLMKEVFVKAKNFDEFKRNVSIARDKFRDCCRGYGVADEVIDNIEKLIASSQGGDSAAWYQYFRNIVAKASIVCEDWVNKEVFQYIKEQTGPAVPVIVYASNILEYIGCEARQGSGAPIKSIMQNIEALNPTYTIHTRTSCTRGARLSDGSDDPGMAPDSLVLLDKNQIKSEHVKLLTDGKYIDLFGKYTHLQSRPQKPQSIDNFLNSLMSMPGATVISFGGSGSARIMMSGPQPQPAAATPYVFDSKSDLGLKKGFLYSCKEKPKAEVEPKTEVEPKAKAKDNNYMGLKRGFLC